MNIRPTVGRSAHIDKAPSTTRYTCCKPAGRKCLMALHYSRFSRFSRLIGNSNIKIRTRGVDAGSNRGFALPHAEPAEPATNVTAQWVKDGMVLAAPAATCCTISPSCAGAGRTRICTTSPFKLPAHPRPRDQGELLRK